MDGIQPMDGTLQLAEVTVTCGGRDTLTELECALVDIIPVKLEHSGSVSVVLTGYIDLLHSN